MPTDAQSEDAVDPVRSALMAKVGRRDTQPEMRLRRALHARGLRFRLQARELPGRPDVIFRKARLAIFVHGCFWHRHAGCRLASSPSTRKEFWAGKFARNVERDAQALAALKDMGYATHVVWECDTRRPESLLPHVDAIERLVRAALADG